MMLTINKNNFDKWRLLLKVLSEEIPESDPVFQLWLKDTPENKELYQLLRKKKKKRVCLIRIKFSITYQIFYL